MKERGQWRALPARIDIQRAKIPSHRNANRLGQCRTIANLMGATPARIMGQGLAVKPDQIRALKRGQQFGMRCLNHLGSLQNTHTLRPLTKGSGNNRPFPVAIGTIGTVTKGQNHLPIGLHHRRVHPVKRSARHRAKRP